MSIQRIKIIVIVVLVTGALAFLGFNKSPQRVGASAPEDAAATYKAKCLMCHTAKATKWFDPAKADDELVQAILKGKKGEKPPFMPGFEEKGITADAAKELVVYMKGLRASGE